MIECSLCGFGIAEYDPDTNIRKSRHEEIHTRKGASKNKIIGKVEWIVFDD